MTGTETPRPGPDRREPGSYLYFYFLPRIRFILVPHTGQVP